MRNSFTQEVGSLIGSAQAIEELEKKDSASVLVISDSHGDIHSLSYILSEYGAKSDALVFCGDGICDFAPLIAKAYKDRSFEDVLPPVMAFVAGNNDYDSFSIKNPNYSLSVSESPYTTFQVPQTICLKVCGHTIFATHGHRHSVYIGTNELAFRAKAANADIVLYGHTHLAKRDYNGNMLILNPGSCSLPRGGLPRTFVILKIKQNDVGIENIIYQINGNSSLPFVLKNNITSLFY